MKWHQTDDGLRAFVRLSEADDRLRGAVDALREAREYADAYIDEYQPDGGDEALARIDAVLNAHAGGGSDAA